MIQSGEKRVGNVYNKESLLFGINSTTDGFYMDYSAVYSDYSYAILSKGTRDAIIILFCNIYIKEKPLQAMFMILDLQSKISRHVILLTWVILQQHSMQVLLERLVLIQIRAVIKIF